MKTEAEKVWVKNLLDVNVIFVDYEHNLPLIIQKTYYIAKSPYIILFCLTFFILRKDNISFV